MKDDSSTVAQHYTIGDLGDRILAALTSAGAMVDALTVDDLAPVDAFHIRGRVATEELASWANVQPEHSVLDVGSGLGGTGRFLASTTGCTVTGIDLTDEYCRVASMLSDRVGLGERTTFVHADAMALPFDDDTFDILWTEHAQMNIQDKAGFYREINRVLKPGGRFAFHDIFAGGVDELLTPVPWANDTSISHLIGVNELRAVLAGLGLESVRWEERTAESIAFFHDALERIARDGPPALGIHLLTGDDSAEKFTNVLRNLESDRVRVVQAVMESHA